MSWIYFLYGLIRGININTKNKGSFQSGEQLKQKLKELAEKLKAEGKLQPPTSK